MNSGPAQPDLTAVVAMTPDGVIGNQGDIPWRLSSDLRRFKRLTMGGALIMGRRTFDSIGRPLPGRRNIVVTGRPDWSCDGVWRASSPDEAVEMACRPWTENETRPESPEFGPAPAGSYVVGGAEIYRELWPRCRRLWLTRVWCDVRGDTKISIDLSEFRLIEQTRCPAGVRDDAPSEFLRLVRSKS